MRGQAFRHRLPLMAAVLLCFWARTPGDRVSPGLDAAVDPSIRPGDDFFGYANGAWLKTAAIPVGKDRWTVRDEINEATRRQVTSVLDEAGRAPAGSLGRKVADFRAALLDGAAIEARGLAPLAPLLARIDRVSDRSALARHLGATMRADVDPLNFGVYDSSSVLGLSVERSIHGEKTYTAFLLQGGLAVGDRDEYLSADPPAVERRARYRRYVARMLALAGLDDADRRADSVLALETAIAQAHATKAASGADHNADNRWSRADFAREAPGMDWTAFFEAAGLAKQDAVVAWQPSAVTGVAALVASQPLDAWKEYLRFHAVEDSAEVLPRAFAEAAAEMRGEKRTPDERALAATQSAMGPAIGELYSRRWFPEAQKARVRAIVADVAAAFRERAATASWLSPDSRRIALAKLDSLYVGVGYPEEWEDWSDLRVASDDAFGNRQRVADRARRRALARLGRPCDPREWVMAAHTAGAVLVFQQNAYEFAAALLQPPKYDSAASDAAAYGSIGAIFGHDMSHFVDVLGAEYEPDGRMRRWWTAEDTQRFDAAADPIVRQFSQYRPLPGLSLDGKLTRTENVADLAGLASAFDAWRKSLGARAADGELVRRGDREFFVAFARSFGAKMTDAGMRAQVATDHAPEMYRMDTVRNLDAWYDAFDVAPGQKLYLDPRDRVRIW
jgi:putative endopeptidase